MSGAVLYKGVPLNQLAIDAVYWDEDRAKHVRERGVRKGTGEVGVEPEWATEASLDPNRLVALARSDEPGNEALKVVGWSAAIGEVLKVWLWSDEPETGIWNGGSAALANESDCRRYWRSKS